MKKRILSVLLAIAMVVGMFPVTAGALPAPHTHPVCGATCTHNDDHSNIPWTAWSSTNSLPTSAGNYYLTANVTINNTWSPKDGTVLCLNGKTITKNNSDSYNNSHAISIGASVTFTLTDCQSAAGTITHGDESYKGCGVELYGSAAVFNMYGGAISGNTNAYYGGGVEIESGIFNMYGGTISNNTANYGGGVYVNKNQEFNMYGGTISSNTASHNGGGGVYVSISTFNMYGGTISSNNATNTATTANVGCGGGVYISGDSGSAVVNMTGGTISGNTSANYGGGVYVYSSSTFNVSGSPVITGNTTSTDTNADNVYLKSLKKVTLTGALSAEAQIGVTLERTTSTFTADWNTYMPDVTNYEEYFSSDNSAYGIIKNGNELRLQTIVAVTGVTLNKSSATLEVNGTEMLTATLKPDNATNKTVSWISSDPTVAKVENGVVTALKPGSTTITVTTTDGGFTATCAVTVSAPAETHKHDMSVDCGGSSVTFEPWDGTTTFPGGNVYLTDDITLTEELTISGTVNLCLNGHSITNSATAAIIVNSGATLNICDCKGGGSVTNSGGTNLGGTTYGIYNSGTVNVYGGTISATTTATTTTAGSGSGIYNYKGQVTVVGTGAVVSGTFYGIYNNSTNGTVSVSAGKVSGEYGIYNKGKVIVGGEITVTGTDCGIYSTSGTVSISGGTVQATGSSGRGIYSTGGTVSVSGGIVQATGNGGYGIYNSGDAVSVSDGTVSGLTYGVFASGTGDITISGGEVSARNSASNSNSYGVYRLGSGAVEITGGTVSGKNGVYLYGSGNVTVSGGTVTGNGSGIYGYGIYLHSSSTGAVSVSGGTVSGTAYGVYTTGNSSGSVTVSGVANISGAQSGILHYGKGTVTVSGGTVKSPQRVTGTTSSGIKILTGSGNVTVSGGTVSGMDYGIYNGGTLTLSNAPTITGDTADIHLDSGKIITISGALTYTEENAISVKMDSAGTFTSGWTTNMGGVADKDIENYFTSAVDDYIVAKENNGELWLAKTYTVTYDGNGATSGTVPTDGTSYASGSTVTVLGNAGGLAKEGYEFSGWNTKADGTGTHYAPDSTFTIYSNTTLYAVWKVPHIHEYTYAVNTENAAQVIESCTCGHSETATLQLDANATLKYTGSAITPITVTYSDGWVGEKKTNADIVYAGNVNVGTATGSLTVDGASAEITFVITPASVPAVTFPSAVNSITYGQALKDAGLTFTSNAYGTFNWVDPNGVPNAGTAHYAVDFTPNAQAMQNYDWASDSRWIPSRNTLCVAVAVVVNKADQAAPAVNKVDETISGKNDGKITDVTANMEYRAEGEDRYTAITGETVENLADGKYYVRVKGDSNHNPSADTAVVIGAGRMLTVTVPQNQVGYTMITTTPEVEYFGSIRVEFKLHDGYSMTDSFQICNGTDPVGFSLMGDTYVYELNFVNSDFNFTVSGVADITAPLAQIDIKNNKWTSFWNGVTFGLFFNETQDVTVTAADTGSGMNSIQYYLAGGELELDEVKQIPVWQDYNGTFKIDPNNRYVVYAKVTDNAGNVSYLNSDGVVLDQTVPVLVGIENNGSYYGDQCFKALDDYLDALKVDGVDVTDEMNADNEYTIVADNAEHIVTATDKAGNATEYKITVFKNYTVTYKVDGNTVSTQTVGHGKDATAPTIPDKEGYTQTAPAWDKDGTSITADTEINAVYTINKYTVTYKADGETVSAVEVEHGKDATAPVIPTKEGYTQTAPAWDKDGKNITADTEINAVYTINEYTITFMDENGVYKTLTYKHGEAVTMPEVSAKDGYTVTWDTTIEKATGNATVNAVYTKNAVSDNPQTGDYSNLWLWWILLIVSAFGITVICIEQKKRKAMR